jgi:hypothetical protein
MMYVLYAENFDGKGNNKTLYNLRRDRKTLVIELSPTPESKLFKRDRLTLRKYSDLNVAIKMRDAIRHRLGITLTVREWSSERGIGKEITFVGKEPVVVTKKFGDKDVSIFSTKEEFLLSNGIAYVAK